MIWIKVWKIVWPIPKDLIKFIKNAKINENINLKNPKIVPRIPPPNDNKILCFLPYATSSAIRVSCWIELLAFETEKIVKGKYLGIFSKTKPIVFSGTVWKQNPVLWI